MTGVVRGTGTRTRTTSFTSEEAAAGEGTTPLAPVVRVGTADFDVGAEYAAARARAGGAGAVVTFSGCVRDLIDGGAPPADAAVDEPDRVLALELEHYPGLTERSVETVAQEAARRWPLRALTVVHRIGRLLPGDQIVLVVVASSHRRAAFEAACFVMDYLKTRAVFWKKEQSRNGARWIESREDDHRAARAWSASDSRDAAADGEDPASR